MPRKRTPITPKELSEKRRVAGRRGAAATQALWKRIMQEREREPSQPLDEGK